MISAREYVSMFKKFTTYTKYAIKYYAKYLVTKKESYKRDFNYYLKLSKDLHANLLANLEIFKENEKLYNLLNELLKKMKEDLEVIEKAI